MDASFSLMSQYTAISARFPPTTIPPASTTAQPTSDQSDASTSAASSSATETISKQSEAAPEAVASTSKAATTDISQISPSADDSSQAGTSKTNVIDENQVTIEDLGADDDNDSSQGSDLASELRRRRLQKFVKTEPEQDH